MMREQLNISAPTKLLTRRDVMRASSAAAAIAALSGLTLTRSASAARADDEISRTAETIHQETVFKASRKRVYDALTDTEQFNKVTPLSAAVQSGMALGSAATKISREAGGTFTLFGGHILGRHIELTPEERIVQAWRTSDWAAGVYSIARFALSEENSGTRLVFDHTGFPVGQAEHLAAGWKANYWEPLAKFLAM
jgi:activator of HSP90 ATPase